jgi:hypothetical protein
MPVGLRVDWVVAADFLAAVTVSCERERERERETRGEERGEGER